MFRSQLWSAIAARAARVGTGGVAAASAVARVGRAVLRGWRFAALARQLRLGLAAGLPHTLTLAGGFAARLAACAARALPALTGTRGALITTLTLA